MDNPEKLAIYRTKDEEKQSKSTTQYLIYIFSATLFSNLFTILIVSEWFLL